MATGVHNGVSKIYISVGFGKLRQKSLENKDKVTKDTPGAKMRKTQQGSESWALEFDWLDGIIENIFYKEDAEHGNSFEVVMVDVMDRYQISFKDDSRFWFDLAKKLPNIDLKQKVKLNPYDFTDKSGKRIVGLSVEQNGKKIESFYSKKDDKGGYLTLHNFPTPDLDMNWKDKDEVKIYTIKVKKFLKNELETKILPKFQVQNTPTIEVDNDLPAEVGEDGLPF